MSDHVQDGEMQSKWIIQGNTTNFHLPEDLNILQQAILHANPIIHIKQNSLGN